MERRGIREQGKEKEDEAKKVNEEEKIQRILGWRDMLQNPDDISRSSTESIDELIAAAMTVRNEIGDSVEVFPWYNAK